MDIPGKISCLVVDLCSQFIISYLTTLLKMSIYGNVIDKEKTQRQIFTYVKKVEPEITFGKVQVKSKEPGRSTP